MVSGKGMCLGQYWDKRGMDIAVIGFGMTERCVKDSF